jgi:hypothetical protein
MYVIGGRDDAGGLLPTVEAYNPQTNTWRSCPPMRQRRVCAVAGVVGGSLVVCGGMNDDGYLASAEAYTAETGWTPLPPLPHAADSDTACVLDGKLFVVGGYKCSKLQVWDGTSWTCKADLPAAPSRATGAMHAGKILWRSHFQ